MNKRRILIVEDEAIVALDIQQRLIAHGYAVVGTAATGARAIELTRQCLPDLVLMDIKLQGAMDGIAAAEEIRKQFYRPVVFLTAYSEEATLQRAKLVEPFGYILKPFEDRELKTIIEIALYKHQADDQIRRLNRLYLVLSRVNQAVVRVKSGPELWAEVCRIVVEQGGFKLAWFGQYDAQAHRITPVAQAGELKDFVQSTSTELDGNHKSQGPAGDALSENRHSVYNDISSDGRAVQWAAAAQTAGFRSAAGFRLLRNGAVAGVLTLYAAQRECFQRHEIELLEEILADVQFALEFLQKDKQRQLAEMGTRQRLKFEHHIATISVRFVGTHDFDAALDASLAEIGQFLGMDRAFVFQLRPDGGAIDNTHEWCAEGVASRKDKLNNLPTNELAWSIGALKKGGNINLLDTAKLPAEAAADHGLLQRLGGKALLLLPLLTGDRLLGFLGFGNEQMAKDWKADDTSLLQVVADIISRTITQRATESSLRTVNERFQAFMGNTPAIAWAKDQRGRYVYLNQTFEVQFGVLLGEWFGKTDAEVWPPEAAQQYIESDKKVLATGMPVETIETIVTATGPKRQWLCIKFPFTDEHGNQYLGGIGLDITEKQLLEAQLRQAQKMEAVGSLAAGIAHDFNNLLCVVMGFGEIALAMLKPTDPLYRHITEMREAGQRAAVLARQLLALSRKQAFEPQVLDLNQTVTNLHKLLERVIRADIDLALVLGSVAPVKADPGQIEQVIVNLVVNARDAMPRGGQLQIETANVTLQPGPASDAGIAPDDYVMLTIRDTGSGMTDEVKAHLFEPFFTTKAVGEGTGLGLATSYGIVKQSGGHITVESAVGKGTTFRIYLPQIAAETAVVTGATPVGNLKRGTETILLVDDDQIVREMAVLMLSQSGYRVLTATNGEKALHLLQEKAGQIQLIISNLNMPKMGGRELAEALQRDYPELKILLTSGYSAGTAEASGILKPGVVFLQKPYTATALASAIRKLLDEPEGTE